jgi:uroporphyrinogen decarboxylase
MIAGRGGKTFSEAKRLAWEYPKVFTALMDELTVATIDYLVKQADAGVCAVQLFDTWAGLLSPDDYRNFAKPYAENIFVKLKSLGIPAIYYLKGGDYLLPDMAQMSNAVIGVDWRVDLKTVRERTGERFAIQGNFDPDLLMASRETIEARLECMFADIPHPKKGYIVNLGHGVEQHTPVENVKFFVSKAQEIGAR